ncbi:MAG: SGNH/GDSL hydrolase family protein [Bryobacteraceae bacterium]|jgi:lysophospholipase L1-like esterase
MAAPLAQNRSAGLYLLVTLAASVVAQQPGPPAALLSRPESIQLETRIVQLVEATMVSTPELSRAGTPLLEDARQALANLRHAPAGLDASYRFLTSMRAYLALADAVPKPYPFPKTAQDQFAELRDSVVRLESHFAALLDGADRALHGPDPDNLARYADTNSRMPPTNSNKPRIVFLGDSITDDWRLNEYFPDQDFVNRGISGQTTDQMLGRFEADVVRLHPFAVLIFGGTNDIGRGMAVSAVENNIRMMAGLAQFNGIKVLLATLLPVSDYHKDVSPDFERSTWRPPERIRELNRWIQGFCGEKGYTFVNYYSEVVDAAGFLKPDLSDDGLHPNSRGYRIMAPVALKAIESAYAGTSPQQKSRRRRLFSVGQ